MDQPNRIASQYLTSTIVNSECTEPYLCMMISVILTMSCGPSVCCFASYKHSYNVNPKNNLNAISMAISETESWKQTYSSWGFGLRKSRPTTQYDMTGGVFFWSVQFSGEHSNSTPCSFTGLREDTEFVGSECSPSLSAFFFYKLASVMSIKWYRWCYCTRFGTGNVA